MLNLKNLLTFERRCSGHCCKAFILPWLDHEQIALKREEAAIHKNEELLAVLDMIIPLGDDPRQFPEAIKKVVPTGNFDHLDNDYGYKPHYYTCKYHCNVTGDCLNYENRPKLCRDFPENNYSSSFVRWNGACEFGGCTRRYSIVQMIKHFFNVCRAKVSIKWSAFKWWWRFGRCSVTKKEPELIVCREEDDAVSSS